MSPNFLEVLLFIAKGLPVTIKVTLLSLIFAFPLALGIALSKMSRFTLLQKFAHTYTSIFRGTPLLVQLCVIHFGILNTFHTDAIISGIITFSLNSAAYMSEIIFSGIKSIDKGQWEASQVLGLSKYQTYRHIILPQALRYNLPQFVNEIADLTKESALISALGVTEIFRRAQLVAVNYFMTFEAYIGVALIYFIMISLINLLKRMIEKKCYL